MANDLFRELTSIARGYINPFFAETIISKWCKECGTTEDDVKSEDLPSILLGLTTDITILELLRPHEFSDMMKRFMALSNRLEVMDRKRVQAFVHDQTIQKGG